jgi:hypothetical protein
LATTHLASHVQNGNSLRSSITPRITRRPKPPKEFDIRRVGGRVHALVRLRLALAHLTPSGARVTAFNLRYAARNPLPSRSGRTRRWLATFQSFAFATRRTRAFTQQKSHIAPAI